MNYVAARFAFSCVVLIGTVGAQTAASAGKPESVVSPIVSTGPAKQITENQPSASISVDPASLLPDLPPVPNRPATLMGGTIRNLDRVRDQMTVSFFGGGHMTIEFDPRTRVYKGAAETSTASLRVGEQIHFDTILDGSAVFTRSIHLSSQSQGETEGVVLRYRADHNELTIRDAISSVPVKVRLTSSTRFNVGNRQASASDMVPGSLVALRFEAGPGASDVASEISVLARPGTPYIFTGNVATLDLSTGLLVLDSATDGKTYEIYLGNSLRPDGRLKAGANVTLTAIFEGERYVAQSLNLDSEPRN
ncbi:MAG TPA: hypothetical protein VMG31_02885 [Verrucomicrobiae bacterium]|nr:hypothetical protein [Verrucomicrobiae bacterium]